MDYDKAILILSSLANGVNPITGEVFASDSPYQSADVVRALYVGLDALEKAKPKAKRRGRFPANAGKPWTDEEDRHLLQLLDTGCEVITIAARLERTPAGIQARLERHGRLHAHGMQWRKGIVNSEQERPESSPADEQA